MKKCLFAIALVAAVEANAQDANVTIYGILDAAIVNERNGSPTSATRLDSGVQSGSRLGFKGSEALAHGLSANFVLESGVNVDTGTTSQGLLFGRQAFVGINGEFGAINLGRQYSPMYAVLDKLDPFHIGLAGNAGRLFNGANRLNNAITYFAPAINGFSANAIYALGESPLNSKANTTVGFATNYDNGPLETSLAFSKTGDPTGNDTAKILLIGGNYDFRAVKAHLSYQSNKGSGTFNTRIWLLGITVPANQMNFVFDIIHVTDRTVSNANANQIAVGLTYDLSKRTGFYTSYSRTSNDTKAKYNVLINGETDKLFMLGMRHRF